MIRIAVTDLETFRYWKANEDSTLQQLLDRLAHREPQTVQMEAGHAFAKMFENATPGCAVDELDSEGWRFTFNLDADIALSPIRELHGEMVVQTPVGPVTVVGKVDGLDGITVRDQKLTETFDAEKYVDSLQWRAYLVMFGASCFIYDVFLGYYPGGKHVEIRDYHRMAFYTYPAMRADVERAVCELAEVIAMHGDRAA